MYVTADNPRGWIRLFGSRSPRKCSNLYGEDYGTWFMSSRHFAGHSSLESTSN